MWGSREEVAWGRGTFLELPKGWMTPTPWLWDLGESLSLSELQLLGCKTTLTLLCGLRGETRSPACQPALPQGFIRGSQQGWHTERHDKPSGPIVTYPLGPETRIKTPAKEKDHSETNLARFKPSQEEVFHIAPKGSLGSRGHFSGTIFPVLWTMCPTPWSQYPVPVLFKDF